MPERATKEKNLTLYTAFGGVAIQNRIAASFFLWRRFWLTQSFSCKKARCRQEERARSPPHSDLISQKFRSEEKKGDIS